MRTVAVLVVIVLLLAGVTGWALMPRGAAPAQGPRFDAILAALTPQVLRTIEVTQPDGKVILIELDPTSRQWILKDADLRRWPVVASRPRALAGLLAEVGKGSREKASEPSGTRTIVLRYESDIARVAGPSAGVPTPSVSHEIRVDATALAGRTRVYTKDEQGQWWSAQADAQFASLFTPESLRAWADTRALVDLGQTASAIRLECADGRITLERKGSRWMITDPKLGNADAQAVTGLLQQLGEFTRVPGIEPSASGSQLVFSATVSSEDPGRPVGSRVDQTLWVSRGAVTPDVVEGEAFAMFAYADSTTLWGPSVIRIDRAKFDAISADPARYIARVATEVPRADIGMIRVTRVANAMDPRTHLAPLTPADAASTRSVTIATNGATWRITPVASTGAGEPASRGVAATPEQERWIAQLRDVLSTTRAVSVSMGGSSRAEGELVLTLASPGGAPLDVVAVGIAGAVGAVGGVGGVGGASEKGPPRVIVRRGNVYLVYDISAGLIEWLERQLPPEG